MYRIRSRSLITAELVDSDYRLDRLEDAQSVVSFFNRIYNHLFEYWFEPC